MLSDAEFDDLEELDPTQHENLVNKVLKLNKKQQLRLASRSEPNGKVSEFNLIVPKDGKIIANDDIKEVIKLQSLSATLDGHKFSSKIGNNLKQITKRSRDALPKPLEKIHANKLHRSIAYERLCMDLNQWEAVVTSNRVQNLTFPLVEQDDDDKEDFSSNWVLKSDLEKELEAHQQKIEQYDINLEDGKDNNAAKLTLKELMAKRKEMAKLRAWQSYSIAKQQRKNKIKSKKYHRLDKKQKIKQKLKEFELLQKTDPDKAMEKLAEIEKARVEERMSLRHKNTGKWAKNKQIRAKYDKEARKELVGQMEIARNLTEKTAKTNDDDEEEEENDEDETMNKIRNQDKSNPWLNDNIDGEMKEFLGSYRKFWLEQQQSKEISEEKVEESEEIAEDNEEIIEDGEETFKNGKEGDDETVETVEDNDETNENDEENAKILNESTQSTTSDWEITDISSTNSKSLTTEQKTKKKAKKSPKQTETIEDLFNRAEKQSKKKMFRHLKAIKKQLSKEEEGEDETSGANVKKRKTNEKVGSLLEMKSKKVRAIIDEEMIEEPVRLDESEENGNDSNLVKLKSVLNAKIETKNSKEDENIDPNNILLRKTTILQTALPDILTHEDDEEMEKMKSQKELIAEAFEEDNLLETEFEEMKNEEVNQSKINDVDLTLPGWGSWSNQTNNKWKKRFIIKAPQEQPRKDDNKGKLIINENANEKIRKLQVSEIPFPFKTVKDFEASLRGPIGNTFVPELAFRKNIEQATVTKMGKIIKPLSKSFLLKKSV